MHTNGMSLTYDVICVGAGPTGLACAIEAKRAGMRPLVIDKGCLCNSIFHYPVNMMFFTTAERMEIGDLPMTISGAQALARRGAEILPPRRRTLRPRSPSLRNPGASRRKSWLRSACVPAISMAHQHEHHAARIILATGYYDRPNKLNIPGEDLPHVSHYFTEPHPYWAQEVAVIGAKNSAAETALDLFRARRARHLDSPRRRSRREPEILGSSGH